MEQHIEQFMAYWLDVLEQTTEATSRWLSDAQVDNTDLSTW